MNNESKYLEMIKCVGPLVTHHMADSEAMADAAWTGGKIELDGAQPGMAAWQCMAEIRMDQVDDLNTSMGEADRSEACFKHL